MSATFRSLYPLPGTSTGYVPVLYEILTWIASTGQPTYEALVEWLDTQYAGKRSTLSNYVQTLTRLEVVAPSSTGQLDLTSFGYQLLESPREKQTLLLAEHLLPRYVGLLDILAVYAKAETELHLDEVMGTLKPRYSSWKTPVPFYERLRWLVSLNCVRQTNGRTYLLTPLGRTLYHRFEHTEAIEETVLVDKTVHGSPLPSELDELIGELEQAALDGAAPRRLEARVSQAFRRLGFEAIQKGDPGETDILIQASIGPHSYTAIVDAKARRDGRLQDLNIHTLLDHRRKYQANYVIVIAESFAGGKLERHALENGIVLMSIPLLVEWLQLDNRTPLNLLDYRPMFDQPGQLKSLPEAIRAVSERRLRTAQVMTELIHVIDGIYQQGLHLALPETQLHTLLARRLQLTVPPEEVQDVVTLLTHPTIQGALGEGQAGISLTMSLARVAQSLRSLANLIDPTVRSGPIAASDLLA